MKKIILFTVLSVFALAACNKPNKTASAETPNDSFNIMTDGHNSQNSLDWQGSYFGVLPCASCPGINTLITLNADGTFEKAIQYKENKNSEETVKGKFQWSKDGSKITLEGNDYLVGENRLIMLDADGKETTGELAEDYVLTKTGLESEPDANNGYTLEKYMGDEGKQYDIVFNTNTKTPTALVKSENTKIILFQQTAWSKGAEYVGDKVKLWAQGNEAKLTIGGKQIKLKK